MSQNERQKKWVDAKMGTQPPISPEVVFPAPEEPAPEVFPSLTATAVQWSSGYIPGGTLCPTTLALTAGNSHSGQTLALPAGTDAPPNQTLALTDGNASVSKLSKTRTASIAQLAGIDQRIASKPKVNARAASKTPTLEVNLKKPSTFRGGMIQQLTQKASITDTAGMAVVAELRGNLDQAFAEIDTNGDGTLDEEEFKAFMRKLGWQKKECWTSSSRHHVDELDKAFHNLVLNEDLKLSREEFMKWYLASSIRIEVETRDVFDQYDVDNSGSIDADEILALLESLGHHPSRAEAQEVINDFIGQQPIPEGGQEPLTSFTFDVFSKWYQESLFGQGHHQLHENEVAVLEANGFCLDWPEKPTLSQLFWYLLTYPLCCLMFITMPDVRRKNMEGKTMWALIEMVLALFWIVVFTTQLYLVVVVICNTLDIPPEVAGLTVVALGTSVPDVLSMYIAARTNVGEMAVNNAIGSHIFNATVSLSVPWMVWSLANGGRPVKLDPQGIGNSILLVIFMLVGVVGALKVMQWKLTRPMGALILFLYVVFLLQYILQKFPTRGEPYFTPSFTWLSGTVSKPANQITR